MKKLFNNFNDLFIIISVAQLIVFPVLVIGLVIGLFKTFQDAYLHRDTYSSYFFLGYLKVTKKNNLIIAIVFSIIILIIFCVISIILYHNYRVLTGKCKICKGKLENKGTRMYLNS